MKKIALLLPFLLIQLMLFSQSTEIDIIKEEKAGDVVTYHAKNNTKESLVVEFTLEGSGFISDKGNNIKVVVKPLAKQEIATITPIPGQTASYGMGFKYYKGNTIAASISGDTGGPSVQKQEIPATITPDDLNSGITLFTKDGCGRCSYAVKYLKDNNIPYREVNITKNKADANVMWRSLEKAGMGSSSVQTPVIVVDGKANFQINDMKTFLSTLKK